MATDNVQRVCACYAQLRNDAVLRSGIFDRERRRYWSAAMDLLHVGLFRLSALLLFDEIFSMRHRTPLLFLILLFRSICLSLVPKTDGVCDRYLRWAAGLFLYQSFDAIDG